RAKKPCSASSWAATSSGADVGGSAVAVCTGGAEASDSSVLPKPKNLRSFTGSPYESRNRGRTSDYRRTGCALLRGFGGGRSLFAGAGGLFGANGSGPVKTQTTALKY